MFNLDELTPKKTVVKFNNQDLMLLEPNIEELNEAQELLTNKKTSPDFLPRAIAWIKGIIGRSNPGTEFTLEQITLPKAVGFLIVGVQLATTSLEDVQKKMLVQLQVDNTIQAEATANQQSL